MISTFSTPPKKAPKHIPQSIEQAQKNEKKCISWGIQSQTSSYVNSSMSLISQIMSDRSAGLEKKEKQDPRGEAEQFFIPSSSSNKYGLCTH